MGGSRKTPFLWWGTPPKSPESWEVSSVEVSFWNIFISPYFIGLENKCELAGKQSSKPDFCPALLCFFGLFMVFWLIGYFWCVFGLFWFKLEWTYMFLCVSSSLRAWYKISLNHRMIWFGRDPKAPYDSVIFYALFLLKLKKWKYQAALVFPKC